MAAAVTDARLNVIAVDQVVARLHPVLVESVEQNSITRGDEPPMSKGYQITSKEDSRQIAEFLAANAQAVLPMVDLIEESMMAIDDLVETLGRATIEAVLLISAGNVAGERRQGVKSASEVGWHGS